MASRREETSDSEEESSFSLSDNENLAPPNKKRRGRKAQWRDCHVADMVDVICSNDNFSRKLIFTNSKNTRNNEVYVQVLKEVEKRYTGSSSFPFSTGQMRTKFKRCVAECKKLALTIKTATGVKRIQEDRGYGPWFNQLFSLVQSRDSCNPELAEEPSSSRNASSSASTETSPEDEGKNLFVPRKRSKEKKKKEDIMTSVVEVLKDMSQQDTTTDLRKFFREENERAREHEMRLFQLFMSGTGSQAFTPNFTAQSQGMSMNNLPALNSPGPSHMYHQPTGSVMAGTERVPNYSLHASGEMYQQPRGDEANTYPTWPTYHSL